MPSYPQHEIFQRVTPTETATGILQKQTKGTKESNCHASFASFPSVETLLVGCGYAPLRPLRLIPSSPFAYSSSSSAPQQQDEEGAVSRFRKLSHTLWHCQYHIVWVPKYRYRVLHGKIRDSVDRGIRAICGYKDCEVVELNVQPDHVHLIVMVPPKVAVSDMMGRVKGQTAVRLFKQLRKKPCWGNHFWARGYCAGTVGVDAEMIRKYVKYQEKKEQETDQLRFGM